MKITTRKYEDYIDIKIEIDNEKYDLGFHSKREATAIALVLSDAAEEIMDIVEKI